jgi:hypothetical protein
MSRAFVKEDAGEGPEPRYSLPDPESPYFPEAAAWALIEGANAGDTRSAELATGCVWGEERLVPAIRVILGQAEAEDNLRIAQLARRFLRAAGRSP